MEIDKLTLDSIRVLIVDDIPQVREGLMTVLKLIARNTGLNIILVGEAQNGVEAIQQAQILHPDVILMDLEMPVMDGYAATQCIKSNDPSIWVVALTIHHDPAAYQQAVRAGVDAFIEKGAPLGELIQAIQKSREAE